MNAVLRAVVVTTRQKEAKRHRAVFVYADGRTASKVYTEAEGKAATSKLDC